MKKLRLALLLFATLSLTACVDIEERYTFNADGSCRVMYGFDMGKALAVLNHLMSDSVKRTPEFANAKDTTLNYYTALPDSIKNGMSVEDVAIAKQTDLLVKMNLQKNQMQIKMSHMAKNTGELEEYLKSVAKMSVNSHLGQVELANNVQNKNTTDGVPLVAGQDYYIYEITPGRFKRVIDKVKFKVFLKKAESSLVMAKAMLIEMPYKLVLNFAKPVKKINNPKAILSADKKSVTLVTDMDEIIRNPAVLELQVDF